MIYYTFVRLFLLTFLIILIDGQTGVNTSVRKRLRYLPLNSKQISTSGISSGAVAATHFYLSNSRMMLGLATYASLQYQCGSGNIFNLIPCLLGRGNVNSSVDIAKLNADGKRIDPLENLKYKRHFIHHGKNDLLIRFENGKLVRNFFEVFSKNVLFRVSESIHSMPTKTCGIPCAVFSPNPGNGCAKCDFSGVYEGLNYVYNNTLIEANNTECRSAENMEGLELVDQSEFLTPFNTRISMLNAAVLYTPPQCRKDPSKCRLHVAFHGCRHSIENDGMDYIKCSGYIETADANNFIILFPQTKKSRTNLSTFFYCWDLHGYTGQFYGTKLGSQNQVVYRMVSRILGLDITFS